MTEHELLTIYQRATGDNPFDRGLRDAEERAKIAEEMRQVIAAPTEAEAIRVIEWWRNDDFVGPGTNLRTVRKVRRLAATGDTKG